MSSSLNQSSQGQGTTHSNSNANARIHNSHHRPHHHHHLHYRPTSFPPAASAAVASAKSNSNKTSSSLRKNPTIPLQHRDFLVYEDAAYVRVQRVNIAQRSVFCHRPPISLHAWQKFVAQVMTTQMHPNHPNRSSKNQKKKQLPIQPPPPLSQLNNPASAAVRKRVSPSFQHVQLMHVMQAMTTMSTGMMIRQVQFSHSTSPAADLLHVQPQPLSPPLGSVHKTATLHPPSSRLLCNNNNSRRDGRYRSILDDPHDCHPSSFSSMMAVAVAMGVLPNDTIPPPPRLSNTRHRLPHRCDVQGMVQSMSDEEIAMKQREMVQESEWEEASPRLIVLLSTASSSCALSLRVTSSSSDFGPPLELLNDNEEEEEEDHNTKEKDRHHNHHHHHPEGHRRRSRTPGVPGLPFAGVELLQQQIPLQLVVVDNPYSMLAPPLEALYSPSQGWRPRPFHDRPAGRQYYRIRPGRITIHTHPTSNKTSNEEVFRDDPPLLCSVALYVLPTSTNTNTTTTHSTTTTTNVFGKISEEFMFPAGQWNPEEAKVEFLDDHHHSRRTLATQKAIFAYNPMQISCSNSNRGSSLHAVVQVYQVSSVESITTNDKAEKKDRCCGDSSVLLKPLGFGLSRLSWGSTLQDSNDNACNNNNNKGNDSNHTHTSSKSLLQSVQWPNEEACCLTLYSDLSRTMPESQEAFVTRLSLLSQKIIEEEKKEEPCFSSSNHHHNNFVEEDKIKTKCPPDNVTPQKVTRGIARMFSSSKGSFKQKQPQTTSSFTQPRNNKEDKEKERCNSISDSKEVGECVLFVSSLANDFLQVLLTPSLEKDEATIPNVVSTTMPGLLVDVSGDHAVLLDPKISETHSLLPPNRLKRSDISRLPISDDPAGYICTSELREVLYLPPRTDKSYETDYGCSYWSLPNFLFLYPRMLKLPEKSSLNLETTRFTIRIQFLQTPSSSDEGKKSSSSHVPASTPLPVFYNRTPWCGPALISQIYTSILGPTSTASPFEIHIRDEIKIRLPPMIDGSMSLQIQLMILDSAGGDAFNMSTANAVANVFVPISSLSRDAGRVTTIIPNGNHRLKLGEFQFQMETRLVSAIHVGDPAVATVLRDFPCAALENENGTLTTITGSRSAATSGSDTIGSIYSVLADATPSAVTCHFAVLLYIHLRNVVHRGEDMNQESHKKASHLMNASMRSLFYVFQKVKDKFADRPEQMKLFIKNQLDLFDERLFSVCVDSHFSTRSDCEENTHFNSALEVFDDDPNTTRDVSVGTDDVENSKDVESVLRKSKREWPGHRSSRTSLSNTAPFTRIAFGASKHDRMRIEAEFRSQGMVFSQFFDDDETIGTSNTFETTTVDLREDTNHSEKIYHASLRTPTSRNTIVHTESFSPSSGFNEPQSSGGEFAQRVRTVAQVILAPCVGPSLPNMLAKTGSSTTTAALKTRKDFNFEVPVPRKAKVGTPFSHLPGSDIEDEAEQAGGRTKLSSSASGMGTAIFVSRGIYAYESIILLWQSAWLDHVEALHVSSSDTRNEANTQLTTFPISESQMKTCTAKDAAIFSYYAHTDILLPLCLKSVALRYSTEIIPYYPPATKVLLDDNHFLLFDHLVEMLARGLLGQSISEFGSHESCENALSRAISSSDLVLDFLVGIVSVFHPEQVNLIFRNFFKVLRDGETEHLNIINIEDSDFVWTEDSLHRVRSSRQLRIRAVEVLATLPCFMSVNYPDRYTSSIDSIKAMSPSWLQQQTYENADEASDQRDHSAEEDRLPRSGWLADLLLSEALSICSLSCEAIVAEALAHTEPSSVSSTNEPLVTSLKRRPGMTLTRSDLLMFQSIAIHAITCVYELVLRRHAIDRRFQTDSCRERIAGLFAGPILDKSLSCTRWLAKMESTHKVRSIWLLCFIYIIQEAPVAMLRAYIRSLCHQTDTKICRFIRLLRLSCFTFQSFVVLPRHVSFPAEFDKILSPWLLQESYNTITAATILVVEECANSLFCLSREEEKVMSSVLDLLLHILTIPQSSVTHHRAIGGAIHALDLFGVDLFLKSVDSNLQHWLRVIIGLMNSTSLAVRSIAVDFVISLLGCTFNSVGDIYFITVIFATILPEVAAREIALFSASGHISTPEDVSRSLWPLRRSIADIEGSNPIDDDRVDPQLLPSLSIFCRACQAVLDGVLIELRLRAKSYSVVGVNVYSNASFTTMSLDADEESLFEAASFFDAESAPVQRLRWLFTLQSLHESKSNWLEASETLYHCSKCITDSIIHLKHVWRPSTFALWYDSHQSMWLNSIGEELGHPDRGYVQVMKFAAVFLEPYEILTGIDMRTTATGRLLQPTLSTMTVLLEHISKCLLNYLQHYGSSLDHLFHVRIETMLQATIHALEYHISAIQNRNTCIMASSSSSAATTRIRYVEELACLRRCVRSISGDLAKLRDAHLLSTTTSPTRTCTSIFVVLRLAGKKPSRFQESTSLPTFLNFESFCICRISTNSMIESSISDGKLSPSTNEDIIGCYSKSLLEVLRRECGDSTKFIIKTDPSETIVDGNDSDTTYLQVYPVEALVLTSPIDDDVPFRTKSFFYRRMGFNNNKGQEQANGSACAPISSFPASSTVVELKVAHEFPCTMSRQRVVLTSEIEFHKATSYR